LLKVWGEEKFYEDEDLHQWKEELWLSLAEFEKKMVKDEVNYHK
jgi:hypothetical protein